MRVFCFIFAQYPDSSYDSSFLFLFMESLQVGEIDKALQALGNIHRAVEATPDDPIKVDALGQVASMRTTASSVASVLHAAGHILPGLPAGAWKQQLPSPAAIASK